MVEPSDQPVGYGAEERRTDVGHGCRQVHRAQAEQRHRPVDGPVALEQRHRCDPGGGELGPDLADPRLGVGLRGEALVGVLLGTRASDRGVVQRHHHGRSEGVGGRKVGGCSGRFMTRGPRGRRRAAWGTRRPRGGRGSSTPSSASGSTKVGTSAIPIPFFSVGENVPEVISPSGTSGARLTSIPGRGMPRSTATRPRSCRFGPASFSATSGVAAPEGVLLPADGPAETGLVRRHVDGDVLAVQRVTHLGAQRVAGTQPAGQHPERLAGGEQPVPERPATSLRAISS